MKRRTFLQHGPASTALLAMPTLSIGPQSVLGANDRVVLAGIGIGGRNNSLLRGFVQLADVSIKTLCDCNPNRSPIDDLGRFIENVSDRQPQLETDMKRVFEDPEIDAVSIATPDHWHGPAAIFACQANKDVYVEKPISHNIWEGRKMVEAAQRYNRVVQCGTQNRSAAYNREAVDYIQSGKLGRVHFIKIFNMKPGSPYTEGPRADIPEGLDYDRWLGPAPYRPYFDGILHSWKMYWDFTAGDLADDGAHQLDLGRWLIGRDLPIRVHSAGGNLAFNDDREVPDTLATTYEFDDDLLMTFELTQWAPYMKKTPYDVRGGDQFPLWMQSATRIEVYGTEGMMMMGRHGGGWQVFSNDGDVVAQAYGRFPDMLSPDPHKRNFIDCIKSRATPNADILNGHFSACLIHLASVATRVGNAQLDFDPLREQITNHDDANALVKRIYRPPYIVPDQV